MAPSWSAVQGGTSVLALLIGVGLPWQHELLDRETSLPVLPVGFPQRQSSQQGPVERPWREGEEDAAASDDAKSEASQRKR